VREYFIEAANLCGLDVAVLLTGTGRLSRILQKDNVQEQRTSRDISPGTEQDLARSTSPDAAPNDATNGYQAPPSDPSGDARGGEILVADNIALSAEFFNKCAHKNGDTSASANTRDYGQPTIEPYHRMPTMCSVRNLPEAPAELAGGRSYGMVVDESPTQESDQTLPLDTSENQHVQSTMTPRPSLQPSHQQNQPPQSPPRENSTIRALVATNCTQPDAEPARQHRAPNLSTPVTAQRYTGSSVTMTTPLSNQAGSATPVTVGRHALQDPAFLHGAMQRPQVVTPSLSPLLVPGQEGLGCHVEGMQHLEHQLQPNVERERQQDVAYQTAMFGPSTNDWIQAAPHGADEGLCSPGSTDWHGLHVQFPVPMAQGFGWDGTSHNALCGELGGSAPQYWLTLFPPDMYD
jgi:hypothetical protein